MPLDRDDKFDEMRRAWIAAHQGWSSIQRRRAELLGRKVRARQRAVANAVPDPHDDTTIPPLWMRTAKSHASQTEMLTVCVAALIAPLGWLGGWLVKRVVTHLIPGTLRAYPIAGRVKSTKTRPGNRYLKGAPGIAALSAAQSNNTYYAAKYKRIASRRGPMRAVVAVEHTMVIAAWNLLTNGDFYRDPGADYFTRRIPAKTKARAIGQLEALGYRVTLEPLMETA